MKYTVCLLVLFSCKEINTTDKSEIFQLWTGGNLPKNVEVINGSYWQSPHFTKEYEVYIQIKSTNDWWKEFKKINNLDQYKTSLDKDLEDKFYRTPHKEIIEQPNWFKPEKTCEVFVNGDSQYFWNPKAKMLFIHEIQL